MLKQLLSILAVLLITVTVNAQKRTITGKITDAKGAPLAGASVKVKSTGSGTSTANDGTFQVEALPTDQLEISIIGYKTQSISASQTSISVSLETEAAELGQVVLVGTRRAGRVKLETPVPVDVVNVGQASLPTARMDLTSIMNYAAPSFNYNKQSGSDGADHIDLATLRGLGPDQTLVLINGKRRHQTAFVAVFGTRGRGNSGTDLSAIPVASIDRVEILRDGASAQYGSDAIAGVINIVLKKNVNQLTGSIGWSGYYDKKYNTYFKKEYGQYVYDKPIDGQALNFNLNYGLPLDKNGGFINFTLNGLYNDKTFRQALDTNQNSKDFMYTNIYRRAHGDASLANLGGFMNMELPIRNSHSVFYMFGGYNYKKSDAYAFTRNFSARPDRFPTTNNGDLIFVDGIMRTTPDGETYYNPHIQTYITDFSVSAGIKGVTRKNWNWDLSNTTGRNNFHFYGDKTFNASLGPNITHFDDGGFSFLQNTINYNLSKEFSKVAAGFNLAFGAEYRTENYQLYSGSLYSYANFSPQGIDKASGSQGFPGYQPSDEVNAHRDVLGGYVDAELDVTKDFLVDAAIRLENYNDFGFTDNYKLAMRYKVSPKFNLRGSVSTGFRAPSLQQINFSSTFTTVQGGNIAEVKIAPNYSSIAKAAGIPKLKQEKSVNGSFGFAWKPINELSVTVDGYWVKVKDRVVLSGQFDATDPNLDPGLAAELANLKVAYAQFFANAVTTTNKGIDLVVDYNKKIGKNSFKALLTANFQNMTIDKINVPAKLSTSDFLRQSFLSDREQKFILASAPKAKMALNLEYGIKKFTVGTRLTYFGKITLLGYGEDGLGINPQVPTDADPNVYVKDEYNYGAKLTTDLYFSYKLCSYSSLYIGADNIFNVHPDLGVAPGAKGWAFNNETGGPWDAVQMGGNGMRLFARIGFNF